MNKIRYFCAIVVATGTLSLAAFAENNTEKNCDDNGHHERHRGDHVADGPGSMDHPPFARILDLTDAQKQTLAADRKAQEPAMRALHEKLRAAHEALEQAAEANASDAELNKLAANSAGLIAQQEVSHVKMEQKMRALLTPEQKQKWADWEAEHKKMRHGPDDL